MGKDTLTTQYDHRLINLVSAMVILITLFCSPVLSARSEKLKLLTWADYIDPKLVAEFEAETGAQISFSYYESGDARNEILTTDDGRGYDIAVVNGFMLESYAKRNWLAPIESNSIPNTRHIDVRWFDSFPGSKGYAVPYFWGTLGIIYRQDLVPKGFASWTNFFEPEESLRGKISMLKSSRDMFGMALKSRGYSVNTNDRNEIKQAGRLLMAQRPFVRSYEYISLNDTSALISGEVWASLAFNGDAVMLQKYSNDIAYVIPKEGSNLWVDYLTVLSASPNQDLAIKFINFLNRPKIAARNAEFVYYATPNLAALKYVSDDYTSNLTINPQDEVINQSEVYRQLAPRSQKTMNYIFAELIN